MNTAEKQARKVRPRVAEAQRVYIGLGSNLGDRARALQEALDRIALLPGTDVLRTSRVYESEPWGDPDQGTFYNAAAEIRTTLDPKTLLGALKDIERRMGRIPTHRNGPRLIDIDILLVGDTVLRSDRLAIPHPGMTERQFVLLPLREIAPAAMHPLAHESIDALARHCPDTGGIWPAAARLTPAGTDAAHLRRVSRRRRTVVHRGHRASRRH